MTAPIDMRTRHESRGNRSETLLSLQTLLRMMTPGGFSQCGVTQPARRSVEIFLPKLSRQQVPGACKRRATTRTMANRQTEIPTRYKQNMHFPIQPVSSPGITCSLVGHQQPPSALALFRVTFRDPPARWIFPAMPPSRRETSSLVMTH